MRRPDRRPFSGALLAASLACLSAPRPVAAQPPAAPAAPPTAVAVRAEKPPVVDGDVLGDPAWAAVPPLTDFWQTAPVEGAPASEPTEVRIVYTADTLYFGVVCHDSDPAGIVVNGSRRDSPARRDGRLPDRPRHLPRPAERLRLRHEPRRPRVRRAGHERGPGRRRERPGGQGGSLSGFNLNWDAAWKVRTRSGDFGWSAEFAIPFRTLRYGRETGREWGLNFQRNLRRRNESSFWAPLPRQYDLFRLSRAGTLAGLEPPPQRNLKLLPYALGEATEKPALGESPRHDGRGGRRPEVERHAEPHARRHGEHRLRAGRGRRAAGQPRPLQPLLPGEAAVLPRERGAVPARLAGGGRPLLLAPDRDRALGRGRPDRRGRAPLGQARRLQRRPARHADPHGRHAGPGQQLRRGPRLARAAEPLARRRHLREPRGHRRASPPPATATGRTAPTAAGASAATARSRATSRRPRRRASRGATTPSTSGRASAPRPGS